MTGLYLAVRDDWLRWVTAAGQLLLSSVELWEQERQHAEQERQRAEQERQRAERAEQLLEEYQRRFGKLE